MCGEMAMAQAAKRCAGLQGGAAQQGSGPATARAPPPCRTLAWQAHNVALEDEVGVLDLVVQRRDVGPLNAVPLGNLHRVAGWQLGRSTGTAVAQLSSADAGHACAYPTICVDAAPSA